MLATALMSFCLLQGAPTQQKKEIKDEKRDTIRCSCGPNEKPCGDGCIAKDSDCNSLPPPNAPSRPRPKPLGKRS
jgi:hypothetical protein